MAKATKVKQISFIIPNRAGLLADVTAAISAAKVNILALCAYETENNAYFTMAVDNTAKARRALAKLDIKPGVEDAVAVEMPNRVGQLQKVSRMIADAGINIDYVYGTTSKGRTSTCIFKTANDKKAIKVINQ